MVFFYMFVSIMKLCSGNLVNILFRECTYFFGEGLFKVTVCFEVVNVFTFGSCSVLGLLILY